MDDRVEGAGKQAIGSIKEAIGKITGDRATEAEGAAERAAGVAQGEVGKTKAAAKDALEK